MNGNHNPGVIPGNYNPRQSKTEVFDYQAFLGSDYSDPTQIPMHPGDTQIPMQQAPPPPPIVQEQQATPLPPLEQRQPVYSNNLRVGNSDIAGDRSPYLSANNSAQGDRLGYRNCSVEAIRIPIVIELTINLNVNHGGNQ